MKICKKCNIEKDISEFSRDKSRKDGLQQNCKSCRREYDIQRQKNNREQLSFYKHEYYKKNKEQISLKQKQYYQDHKDECAAQNKRYRKENKEQIALAHKQYYETNREKVAKYKKEYALRPEIKQRRNNRHKNRWKNDIQHKLRVALRNRLCSAVRRKQKSGSAIRDLGCSIAELKTWLENQFVDGMTWDNWGTGDDKWQIDHIIPLSSFDLTDREQFLKACHYTNLQPLWAKDNLSKGARTCVN